MFAPAQILTMNRVNVAIFFAALLVIGACAEPRKLLADAEGSQVAAAEEQQRILAELEEVSTLRERMLQEGKLHLNEVAASSPLTLFSWVWTLRCYSARV